MDINNTAIERARTPTDLTHQFKANYSYDLPLGEGHRIHGRFLDPIIGGWMTSGEYHLGFGQSIFDLFRARARSCAKAISGDNEATTLETLGQLANKVKFRMTGNGPYIVPASAIGVDGRGVAPPDRRRSPVSSSTIPAPASSVRFRSACSTAPRCSTWTRSWPRP